MNKKKRIAILRVSTNPSSASSKTGVCSEKRKNERYNTGKTVRVSIPPYPFCILFQIHGSKFKLHPVCHMGQASVLGVTHVVLFFRIGKYTLDLLFSQPVQFFVHRHIPDMLRHLHIVLPDMAHHRFLAPGAFGTYPSGRTAFAKISPAFVFPVALPAI